jgi:periplasmic divalent cation tolerance protein
MKIVITTFDKEQEAKEIARKIVESGLGSCVQLMPVESIYKWEGKLTEAKEFQVSIKAADKTLDQLLAWLEQEHSYDTPEIIVLNPEIVNKKYLEWINE